MDKIAFWDYVMRCNWDDDILAELIGIPTVILQMWVTGEVEPNRRVLYRVAGWISVKLDLNQDEVFKNIMGENNE
jgi:hypothetical protein